MPTDMTIIYRLDGKFGYGVGETMMVAVIPTFANEEEGSDEVYRVP